MLTIQDLQRINDLPGEPSDVDEQRVCKVVEFKSEITEYIDNLSLYNVDFINNMNGLFSYWYMLQQNPWLKDKCIVGLMGAYSAGKSTLLSALLGINLPVGINPVTAVPTYVAHGAKNKHCLVDNDDNVKVIPSDLEPRLSHEEAQGFNLRKLIQNTVLFKQSDLLRKISFLDTPGITTDNEYDYTTTANAANKCDIVVWVIKASGGAITQFEVEFIQKFLEDKKIYIVLTYADRCPNLEKVKTGILSQLKSKDIDVADVFYFGKNSTPAFDVTEQIKALTKTFTVESNNFQQFQPQEMLNKYLKLVQDTLNDKINEVTEAKNEVATQCREFERSIKKVHTSLINDVGTLRGSINNLQNTIQNKCLNTYACFGGTYSVLQNNCSSMIDCYNSMINSLNNFDVDQMVSYGQAVSYLERITEILENHTEARNKCVQFIKQANSILK